ncbi:DegT/DnrJ/EryC1/StrS family aminotransferase, partial [Candidatus Sumerlaeota bacterium]|nr:DegT/DnrJ/EryC1/StrS family aminotransferase [Candidatus Sumerlaeota bacterium]
MPKLAIQGGQKVRTKPWFSWPTHDEREVEVVSNVIRSGNWGGYPMPNTHAKAFAEAFARRHDAKHAICVANGTVSLEIGLQAMQVEPGSEVIVPAYTFEATAAAALFSECAPVFVDIDPETYTIDPAAIEAAITPRTRAIIPVHLACRIADMDRIMEIAAKHNLKVLEDCAHAHGGRWKGKGVGSLGHAGSFSMQSSKLMTAGEGGIVTTNDDLIFDHLFALTNCGRQRPEGSLGAQVIGHNYRLSDIQAAILEVQLTRLDSQHAHRNKMMEVLDQGIPKIHGLKTLKRDPRITTQAAYQYVFKYNSEFFGGVSRDAFVVALNAEGVPCDGLFYECLYASPLMKLDEKRYPAWAASQREYDCPHSWRAAYEEAV